MGSSAQACRSASARGGADSAGREQASTLAGLVDVLDRADGPGRPRSVHRTAAPLRSVQPAPSARAGRVPVPLVPRVVVVPDRVRRPLGGLHGLVRRASMWGAGEHGEHLAWRAAAPASPPVPVLRRGALRALARRMALWGAGNSGERLARGAPARHRSALRALARRMALWGAGNSGEHLARGAPGSRRSAAAPVRRDLDPPVVLRELPGTPSIQPVAPSPAAALLPVGPASSPGSRTGTAAGDATARRPAHPSSPGHSARPRPHVGRPPRDRASPVRYGARSTPPSSPVRSPGAASRVLVVPPLRSSRGSGTARTRGDPAPGAARGSPPPSRRAGPADGFPPPFSARSSSSHSGPAPPAAG